MFSLGYARNTFMFVGTQEEVSSLFSLCMFNNKYSSM